MLHQFPRTFALPLERGHRRHDAAVLVPLTPAAYLKLRREAAGLSIADVARRMAPTADDAGLAADIVRQLETPGRTARCGETLERLRSAFAFDPDVYRQLATEPADRHPRVCRGCGCSQWDACDEEGQGCAWATASGCTRCLRNDAAQAERAQ